MGVELPTSNLRSINQLDWNELDARLRKAYSCLGGIPLAREVEEARELIEQAQNLRAEMAICWRAHSSPDETLAPRSFQDRVFDWARDCFGERDTTSPDMRTYRFLEEALELAQACGCDRGTAARVLDYVYGRPAGVVAQEVGGTMVSLAVLCQAFHLGMSRCAEDELTRVLGKIEHIRARHAAKPDFSTAVKTAVPPVVGWLGRNGEATTAADEVPATPRPVVNATMCGGHSDENGPIDTVVVCPHCGGKVGVESVTLVPTS